MKNRGKTSTLILTLRQGLGWLVLGGLLVGIGLLWWSFRVELIICRIEAYPCPPSALAVLTKLKSKPLLFWDPIQFIQAELQTQTGFTIKSTARELPDTLVVELEPQPPRYGLQLPLTQEAWLVAAAGQAYQGSPSAELAVPVFELQPTVAGWQAENGQVLPELHRFLLKVATGLQKHQIRVQQAVVMSDQDMTIYLPGELRVRVDAQDPELQLERLKLLLDAQNHGELPSTVKEFDVRYKLPVLRTQ